MSLLLWLDDVPTRYWTLCFLLYFAVLALSVLPGSVSSRGPMNAAGVWKVLLGDRLFLLLLGLMLLAFRWPVFFFPGPLDPDEATNISQAITLQRDPIFWRAVAAGTSGPLNIYPQAFLHAVGFPATYATSRLLAAALVIASLCIFHGMWRRVTDAAIARVATLLPASFFAFTMSGEFAYLTSEHVPLALLLLATSDASRLVSGAAPSRAVLLRLGLTLGAVPFAKLQGTLIALVIAAFSFAVIGLHAGDWQRRARDWAVLTLGGLSIPLFFMAGAACFGAFGHFWQSYVVINFAYAESGENLGVYFAGLPKLKDRVSEFVAYLNGAALAGLLGFALLGFSGRWRALRRKYWLLLLLVGCGLAAATAASIAPRRPFPHYFLFMVFPLASVAVAGFAAFASGSHRKPPTKEAKLLALFAWLILAIAAQVSDVSAVQRTPEIRGHARAFSAVEKSPLAQAVLRYAAPGQPILVWGWMNELHVETGTGRATRDVLLEYLWNTKRTPPPNGTYLDLVPEYFKTLFLADLRHTRPPVIVDAVAPGGFAFTDRRQHGVETYPALATYIRDRYELREELAGVRIFVRTDLPAR